MSAVGGWDSVQADKTCHRRHFWHTPSNFFVILACLFRSRQTAEHGTSCVSLFVASVWIPKL